MLTARAALRRTTVEGKITSTTTNGQARLLLMATGKANKTGSSALKFNVASEVALLDQPGQEQHQVLSGALVKVVLQPKIPLQHLMMYP